MLIENVAEERKRLQQESEGVGLWLEQWHRIERDGWHRAKDNILTNGEKASISPGGDSAEYDECP